MLLLQSIPAISAWVYTHSLNHHHGYISITGIKGVSTLTRLFPCLRRVSNAVLPVPACVVWAQLISLGRCGLGNGRQVNLTALRGRCSECARERPLTGTIEFMIVECGCAVIKASSSVLRSVSKASPWAEKGQCPLVRLRDRSAYGRGEGRH